MGRTGKKREKNDAAKKAKSEMHTKETEEEYQG